MSYFPVDNISLNGLCIMGMFSDNSIVDYDNNYSSYGIAYEPETVRTNTTAIKIYFPNGIKYIMPINQVKKIFLEIF